MTNVAMLNKSGRPPATGLSSRIWLDDIKFTLKNIFLLWRELPQDVRIDEETLPASMVLYEVLEYLRKLKSTLDIHDIADRITELDDLFDDRLRDLGSHREMPMPEPQPQSASQIAANKQNYLEQVYTRGQLTISGFIFECLNPSFYKCHPTSQIFILVSKQGNFAKTIMDIMPIFV